MRIFSFDARNNIATIFTKGKILVLEVRYKRSAAKVVNLLHTNYECYARI